MFNFLYCNLCLLLLISLPCVYCLTEHQWEESASLIFTSPTIRHSLHTQVRSLPSLLFGRLNSPSSPSLSLCVRCFNPFTSMALHWTHTMCVSCAGQPSPGQCSRCKLTRAEQRGRVTSLGLLSVLFPKQPRRLLAFFPSIASSLSAWHPPECVFYLQSCFPASAGTWSYSCLATGLCIVPCWVSWDSCQPISQPAPVPLNDRETTWCPSPTSLLCILCKTAE